MFSRNGPSRLVLRVILPIRASECVAMSSVHRRLSLSCHMARAVCFGFREKDFREKGFRKKGSLQDRVVMSSGILVYFALFVCVFV